MLLGHLDSIVFLSLLYYLLNWEFYKYPYRLQIRLLSFVILKKGLRLSTSDGDRVYSKLYFRIPRYNQKMGLFRQLELSLILSKICGEKRRKSLFNLPLKKPDLSSEPMLCFGLISAPSSVRSVLSTSRFQTNS